MAESQAGTWFKVAGPDELAEGRTKSVYAGQHYLALVHFDGQYAAMDNACPHQGGPLGEGSIEKGEDGKCWLRCPWHGWDFDPLTGKSPGGHEDSGQTMYPVEIREDGIYVLVPGAPAHLETVSDVMAESLTNWGVSSVFGMVGHSNLGLADALRRQAERGRLHYYGIRHEGAAAFAVSAYGKLTGRPAAALTIAGPGATNLMTGMWDAKVDRAPALALTGQVQEQVLGVHAFQDIDLMAAFGPVAELSQTVHQHSDHAELVNQAVKTALVKHGVGHLVFPDNVQTIPAGEGARVTSPEGRLGSPKVAPDPVSLSAAMELLKSAKRPMIITGYGALEGMNAVTALAEKLRAPIATTFKAKGHIGDSHPLAIGVLGRSGTPMASWFMNECDLILAFGASFSDHTGIYPGKRIIQVDLDQTYLGKRHPVSAPVLGDVGVTARLILEQINQSGGTDVADQREEIAERRAIWKAEKERRMKEYKGEGVGSAAIFTALSRLAPEDAIFAVDVGNNTYSFGRYFEPQAPTRVLMSGYLGSIGFSLPAAMGAYAATVDTEQFRGRKVISVSGDGGLGQYAMELATVAKYDMNICHILLNNAQLGKITKEQSAGHFEVWETGLVNPSFAGLAESCGIPAERVDSPDTLESALTTALGKKGPAFVEITTDAELV
ncbi:MAG: thiamine pyrophosphate-dependent enzyme [Pseudomonadota bacterium]